MKKKVKVNEIEYEVIREYTNGFDKEQFINKCTDYFMDYDYILGDWAYDKLRLKGFCNKDNKLYKKINDYETIDSYIKEKCAYECRYFIVKKI
ncbi:MAG: YutD family protein [Bacilli bacterium]|nr:YutD family protein [Bacilli bacterium]